MDAGGIETDLEAVTTDGDVALLYERAKAKKLSPARYIADYYAITLDSAQQLIYRARGRGFLGQEGR